MNTFKYPSKNDIIQAHDDALKKSGGLTGIKDAGQIESALHHIENENYYPNFIDKLTHLTFSMIKNHCFNDGNKRSAITSSHLFIHKNVGKIPNMNNNFCSDSYINAIEHTVIFVADNIINTKLLKNIMEFMLTKEPEYLQSFKSITIILDEQRIKQKFSDEQVSNFLKAYMRYSWLQKILFMVLKWTNR